MRGTWVSLIFIVFGAKALHENQMPRSFAAKWKILVFTQAPLAIMALTSVSQQAIGTTVAVPLNSDEVSVTFLQQQLKQIESPLYLGISLQDTVYKRSTRCIIESIKPDASAQVKNILSSGMILVAVNGENVEGYRREIIADRIKSAQKPISLVFRDPQLLFQLLNSSLSSLDVITSSILPVSKGEGIGRFFAPALQLLKVTRADIPTTGKRDRSANVGDVLELSYSLSMKNNGTVVGSSSSTEDVLAMGTRLSSETDFFVLGSKKMPMLEFLKPEALLVLKGMCVGELRKVEFPMIFSVDDKSPEFVLQARLLSINGVQ